MMQASEVASFSLKEWFLATRPKTLPTALVPFLVGTFLALANGYAIQWNLMVFAWLSAISIQIGTNLTNDAYDFIRKTDSQIILGPQRATRCGLLSGTLTFEQVRLVGMGFFGAALLLGAPLALHGGWPVAVILLISVFAGFSYTGGPFPLAYHGLGDVFVMVFYGFVGTNAAYWLQSGQLDQKSFLLSLQVGCLCTSMIAINNLRDVYTDVKSAKITLPVRYGVLFGRLEVTCMLVLPLIVNLFWPTVFLRWLPWISAPLSLKIIYNIWKNPPSATYNGFLAMSGVNMLAFCLLQALGFFLA